MSQAVAFERRRASVDISTNQLNGLAGIGGGGGHGAGGGSGAGGSKGVMGPASPRECGALLCVCEWECCTKVRCVMQLHGYGMRCGHGICGHKRP